MQLSTLEAWQHWIKQLHPKTIELGLERVHKVWQRLATEGLKMPCVVVGGTNGKGSTVKTLEAVYLQAGYRVGVFTSPYLFRFNEYVRVNGVDLTDETYCRLFSAIETQRQDIPLTPFEYVTLAALLHFSLVNLDVAILEVGLGGRLDAVNIIDAEVAIVTSIGLDHQAFLGATRERISLEKVEIARKNRPLICGDKEPPPAFLQRAHAIGAKLYCIGSDFNLVSTLVSSEFYYQDHVLRKVPRTSLYFSNIACALQTVQLLQKKLPITEECIREALGCLNLPARLQVVHGCPELIIDVSHNVDAVRLLANWLKQHPHSGKNTAVFSMLADKDIDACIQVIRQEIDEWYVAPILSERGRNLEQLQRACSTWINKPVFYCDSVENAFLTAKKTAAPNDRLVVFGSFQTAAPVLELIASKMFLSHD